MVAARGKLCSSNLSVFRYSALDITVSRAIYSRTRPVVFSVPGSGL